MSLKSDFIKTIRHQPVHPVPFSIKFTVEGILDVVQHQSETTKSRGQ
jgi:hypothetical protein